VSDEHAKAVDREILDVWMKTDTSPASLIREANDLYLQLAEDPKMDFKVGDVVRIKASDACRHNGVTGVVRPAPNGAWDWSVTLEGNRGDYGFNNNELELVSRLSEAKPTLKVGDLVKTTTGFRGYLTSVGDTCLIGADPRRWYPESISPDTLKVGDRVRIEASPTTPRGWSGGTGRVEEVKTEACLVYAGPGSRVWCRTSDLELLPPEPAKVDAREWLEMCPPPSPEPVNVTEANREEKRLAAKLIERSMRKLVMQPNAVEQMREMARRLDGYTMEELPPAARLTPSLHESGPGIAKLNLKKPATHRDRLMTTSWAPYGDWDNLPDAD
jgi:ribosomal protein L21E